MRHWTLEEATAALPEVREKVQRLRQLVSARPTANGQGARLDTEIAALVAELNDDGIIVRDPERGLIDFPALTPSGETYLLCWLDGEDAIDWWHWPDAGFAGRTPLDQPPTSAFWRRSRVFDTREGRQNGVVSRCGGRRRVGRGRGRRRRCPPR